MPTLDFCWGATVVPDAEASAYLCETAENQMALIATSASGAWSSRHLPELSVSAPPSGPNNSNLLFRIGATVYVFAPSVSGYDALPLSITNHRSTGPSIVRQPSKPASWEQFFDFYSGVLITRSNDKTQTGFGYVVDHKLLEGQRILAANVQSAKLILLSQEVRAPYALSLNILPVSDGTADRSIQSITLPIAPDPLSIWTAIVTKGEQVCLKLDRNLARDTLGPSTPKSGFAFLCNRSGGTFELVAASDGMIIPVYERERDIIGIVTASEAIILDPSSPQTSWQTLNHGSDFLSPSAHGFTFAPSQKQFEWLSTSSKETTLLRLTAK